MYVVLPYREESPIELSKEGQSRATTESITRSTYESAPSTFQPSPTPATRQGTQPVAARYPTSNLGAAPTVATVAPDVGISSGLVEGFGRVLGFPPEERSGSPTMDVDVGPSVSEVGS
jgi:hypothetical protein